MIHIDKAILRSPYSISILIHLFILLILAFILVPHDQNRKWFQLELDESMITPPIVKDTTTGNGLPKKAGDEGDKANSVPQSSTKETKEDIKKQGSAVSEQSRTIEMPSFDSKEEVTTPAAPGKVAGTRGKVARPGTKPGSGGQGNSFTFDGDGVTIKSTVAPDLKVSDYGEVRLEFSIGDDMKVIFDSIRVLKSGTQAQNESSIRALKQWTFKTTSANSTSRTYSVLFRFNPS